MSGQQYSNPVKLSVVVPTRNRAALWQSAWLLDSLRAQTEPPDELVIALDHTEDDTLTAIQEDHARSPTPFPVLVLEVLAPRPTPFPASGIPDNCLFHTALGDIILHVDDDITVPPRMIATVRAQFDGLPNCAIWYPMDFVDKDHNALKDGADWRDRHISSGRYPQLPGGVIQPEPHSHVFTGATFATTRNVIRKIGGHALETCGFHNQDTRLGDRIARLYPSFLSTSPKTRAQHLGTTWHMQNRTNGHALREAYGPPKDPKVCNGGPAFWASSWFESAYREILTLDAGNPGTTIT